MSLQDWVKMLGGPVGQVLACMAVIAMGAAILLAYVGKRDKALRDEIEAETNKRITALETRIAALERRFTEARAINAEAIAEASRLGEPANHLCLLLVRQAAVLG